MQRQLKVLLTTGGRGGKSLMMQFSFLIHCAYNFKHAFYRLMKWNSQKDKQQKFSDDCLNASHRRISALGASSKCVI